MNIFILNTGRCGSTTFIKACKHISNYSCAHESRTHLLGVYRLDYPENHIEADNRLSWLLGRLDKAYGPDAVYVHLKRNTLKTATSFVNRYNRGIIRAYRGDGIIMRLPESVNPLLVALDYCETVNANIELFLRNKPNKLVFNIEHSKKDFQIFWETIGAEGDIDGALAEFDITYNASN